MLCIDTLYNYVPHVLEKIGTRKILTIWCYMKICFTEEFSLVTYHTGGYLHDKAYRDMLPKWVSFSPKSLDKGPILVKYILRRRSPFTKIVRKFVKSAAFEAEKALEMGPD